MSNFVVLVVEDDAFHRELIADLFKDRGLEVVECSTAEAAELILATTGTELLALSDSGGHYGHRENRTSH
jgi:CheY-like chemotaxis protein